MKDETKTALGVAYLTVIIIASFSLMTGIANALSLEYSVKIFVNRYSLWIVIAAGILFTLYKLNKKQNQSLSTIFKDNTIRKTSGIVVIIYGILDLASSLPIYTFYILSIEKSIEMGADKSILVNSAIADSICLVLTVVLIILGIYLLKYQGNKAQKTEE